ncbi:MAG TPA: 30S ribosomal protein S2 [Candidatus Paceibacterota bacterium]
MGALNTEKKNPLIEKLFSVGAHFGYTRTRRHPSIAPFIFGIKNRVELFDLEQTSELLERAKQFVYELGQHKKVILFVSGKHELRTIVKNAAESIGMPYVAGRWIGGTFTNFTEIKKRLERLETLKNQREKGELEKKYTKREILEFDREIEDLERGFGGIAGVRQLPAALFAIDSKKEIIAIREARQLKIPVVGLMNSDGNFKEVTYPIVGNDSAAKSVTFFVEEIARAYKDGLQHSVVTEQKMENRGESLQGAKQEDK